MISGCEDISQYIYIYIYASIMQSMVLYQFHRSSHGPKDTGILQNTAHEMNLSMVTEEPGGGYDSLESKRNRSQQPQYAEIMH